MSSHADIIRVYNSVDIDSNLVDAARSECDDLDLNTTASFQVFQPKEKCVEIIDSVKKQSSRISHGRSVYVTHPGANTPYLRSPCIAIPIKSKGLPTTMITRGGVRAAVDWKAAKAWEILQDVRPGAVYEGKGVLLLVYLMS